jgi:hypothetical protein
LRDEAPRPLNVESRAPLTVKSLTPLLPVIREVPIEHQPSPDRSGIQYAGEAAPSTVATSVHFEAPYGAAVGRQAITPQAVTVADELRQPRRHIIIDGDSLARLAGRYLDDPHRAEEIFELNRHVLSDPELLPIGVEIAIPPRDQQAERVGASPQSHLPNGSAIHAASRGLVPVRPIPSSATVTPRAQLSRPQPVQ